MLFSSSVFIIVFLPLLFLCYFIVPGKFLRIKNLVLLVFSLIFYAFGGVKYLGLFSASILINYFGGLLAGLPEKKSVRKLWLIVAMVLDLGLLAYFKYAGFFMQSISSLGFDVSVPQIVLPIGISFFTFQGASYVIDVYRGDAKTQKNPLNVALYIALFPQLIAGPIVRYTTIEEEITKREHSIERFAEGLTRFMLGFGKKMILANSMGYIADKAFSSEQMSVSFAWLGAIAYTFQIYFDFSAYSDMAIGLGRIFGFDFLENFNYPYIARSVTDFWRRWHISLSSWFRDYVYIPLGGNRCSKSRHIFNLMVVWALTGLWHGANWTFVVWGVYFGIILIVEKYITGKFLDKIPCVFGHIITLIIVIVSWVLFRADSISGAFIYLKSMFSGDLHSPQTTYYLTEYLPEFILCIVACLPIKVWLEKFFANKADSKFFGAVYTIAPKLFAAIVFVLGYFKLASGSFNPFIYFQF